MSTKKPLSSAALREQRAQSQTRLEELRQQQVDAIEQGDNPQHDDEIMQIKERLSAVDAAITRAETREGKERDRQALQTTRIRAGDYVDKIQSTEAARLQKLDEAQAKFADAVAALTEFFDLSNRQHQLLKTTSAFIGSQPEERRRIKGRDWSGTTIHEVPEAGRDRINTRVGHYLCNVIATVFDGVSGQQGYLSWATQGDPKAAWIDMEKSASEGLLQGDIRSLRYVESAIPEMPHAETE